MPNSRPRVQFKKGICNGCLNSEDKKQINWNIRKKEFQSLISKYKNKSNYYDCVVPFSGGKDSATIAYKLKFIFGLNPLLVTASPLMPNEIGAQNREEIIKLGFDNVFIRPNQKVSRYLARRFFIERGNPKIHWEASKEAIPMKIAIKYNIPLIFYAEHGESEYGGLVMNKKSKEKKNFSEIIEHIVGDNPNNWADEIVKKRDLVHYNYPSSNEIKKSKLQIRYFSYFFRWSMYDNYKFIKKKINFRLANKGRTEGSLTNFDSLDDKIDTLFYYMQYIKFGFGRCVRDASRMIQNKVISRKKGLYYAKKYDHEKPSEYFNEQIDYLNISRKEFDEIVDKHRNQEIWKYNKGKWSLKYPLK